MITLYIAGPFTADSEEGIERNIRKAEAVARRIIGNEEDGARFSCVVPHSLGRCFTTGPGSPEYWYASTKNLLERCDAVVLVDGHERSIGSLQKLERAKDLEMPIFLDDLHFSNVQVPEVGLFAYPFLDTHSRSVTKLREALSDSFEQRRMQGQTVHILRAELQKRLTKEDYQEFMKQAFGL